MPAGRAAVAARIAPVDGTAAESMRQATRRVEPHMARQLAKVRASSRLGAARRLIAAEALAAVAALIAAYRGGGRFSSDYEAARLTVALRDLRVWADAVLDADLRAAILRTADLSGANLAPASLVGAGGVAGWLHPPLSVFDAGKHLGQWS